MIEIDLSLSVHSRLIQNYKVENEAFSYSQDIYDFIEMEKENISADDVPVRLITKAIKELWVNSGEVVISQRRRSKGGVRERGYLNLKRKLECSATTSNHCEWNELPKITFAGWQSAANSDRSLSFLRVEHVLYDDHRVVTEVILQYTEERELKVWLKSHEHTINLCDFPGFESALKKGRLTEKVKFVLNFVEKSSFCRGFKFDLPADTPISPDLYIKHEVRDLRKELEASEARVFSSNCLVLTNNAQGESCVNCVQAKHQLGRIKSRRESSGALNPRCNNRYLSRTEILDKLTEEKRKRINREKVIARLNSEMVEMASEDHADLVQMMSNIPGKEVPDDLKILWEQQQKIASTASGRGYRWHPK